MPRFDSYTDETPMPWGKYKDKKLIDVPASYLLWLGEQIEGKVPQKRNVTEHEMLHYITENKQVLEKQSKEVLR